MTARRRLAPGFLLVFCREVDWLRRRRFLLALTTLAPLLAAAALTAIFGAGLATDLPVGVLDLDRSMLSRSIIRKLDATPDAAVAVTVTDLAEGRRALLAGRIHGLLLLPASLERDALRGRRPEVVFFYNGQTMSAGNVVLRGAGAAVAAATAEVRLALRGGGSAAGGGAGVVVDGHTLFNPALDYVHFLLAAAVPAVLQIAIVTGTAYAVGLDVAAPHRLRILRRLGGGLGPALAGKLLPYTLLYLLFLVVFDAVLVGAYGLPLRGRIGLMLAAGVLFILASQMAGLILALVFRPAPAAISYATLLTAPAFGFMGIGFPRLGMGAFAQGWGAAIPGTWYLEARIDQTVRGTPLDLSLRPIVCLALILGVLAAVAVLLLVRLRRSADRARTARRPAPAAVTP